MAPAPVKCVLGAIRRFLGHSLSQLVVTLLPFVRQHDFRYRNPYVGDALEHARHTLREDALLIVKMFRATTLTLYLILACANDAATRLMFGKNFANLGPEPSLATPRVAV